MCIPYWDSELDVEVGCWASFNFERCAVSMVGLHSEALGERAALALSLNSELLYLCGGNSGIAGSMIWEEPILENRDIPVMSPFTLVLGYSREMEAFTSFFLKEKEDLKAGVTDCTFWTNEVPLSRYKVIAFMAAQPLFDEIDCLNEMRKAMKEWKHRDLLIPFYAEQFGFVRAPVPYETDIPKDMLMTNRLQNFQLEATRSVVGPAPSVSLPAFYELTMGNESVKNEEDGS